VRGLLDPSCLPIERLKIQSKVYVHLEVMILQPLFLKPVFKEIGAEWLFKKNLAIVLETQQSSDTTYRVYDYDRRDAEGNLRDLHLAKGIEVTTVPHRNTVSSPVVQEHGNSRITTFVESDFFSVYKWEVRGKSVFAYNDQYLLLSVIKGKRDTFSCK